MSDYLLEARELTKEFPAKMKHVLDENHTSRFRCIPADTGR